MAFTFEEKLKAVSLVCEDRLSFLAAGRNIGASKSTVLAWVQLVREHGIEALRERHNSERHSYPGEFKLKVVEYMHENKMSCYSAAAYFKVAKTQIQRWDRIYYEEGVKALLEERRGKKKGLRKPRKNVGENKELLAELEQLRMENEYLKKLNALVQERIKRECLRK